MLDHMVNFFLILNLFAKAEEQGETEQSYTGSLPKDLPQLREGDKPAGSSSSILLSHTGPSTSRKLDPRGVVGTQTRDSDTPTSLRVCLDTYSLLSKPCSPFLILLF